MCGIVGILGNHEAAPILVEALKRLEYRGYDSAGIATVHEGKIARRRAVGKLVNLSDLLVHEPLTGKTGVGQTRWATHGAPSVTNAHPHRSGPVSVVHNGIIENFRELRAELTDKGYPHCTDTDTEPVALLCHSFMDAGKSPVEAVMATVDRLEGAFALCFMFEGQEDLLIAARKGAPLAIGHGQGEMFVGSDAIALAPMTNQITYLNDGDRAVLTRTSVEIFDETGAQVQRERRTISMNSARIEKAGHKHFMAKEIAEQPTVISEALAYYLSADSAGIVLPDPGLDFSAFDRIIMVACGTAFYACYTAKYWFEQVARIPVEIDVASEFRYREPPVAPRTLAIFVSQSGETADTLAALRYMSGKADKIVSVVNVAESSIARESDIALPILAGVEVGVASTKAFSCQLTVLALLALEAATQRGEMTPEALTDKLAQLRTLPGLLTRAIDLDEKLSAVSNDLSESRDVLFLGRGLMYPLALEGALKLKEISYIHAEGYASGELKHGPIALIDSHTPVIVFAPHDALFEKTVSNMQEVMARGGKVLLVSDKKGLEVASEGVWQSVQLPDVPDLFAPILYAVPAQLIAYHTAVAKGTDVDQPRNLAKSVTVE